MQIIRLYAFEGPNRYHPNPAVVAWVAAAHNQRVLLLTHIKQAAQQIGIVLAYIDLQATRIANTIALEVHFTTPTPVLGAALLRYAVAASLAEATGDTAWDGDQQLFDLQQQRRAQALPLSAIQLMAEAHKRQIPCFRHTNGMLQLGYGIHGIAIPIAAQTPAGYILADAVGTQQRLEPQHLEPQPHTIDWAQVGTIPITVISGPNAEARQHAQLLHTRQHYQSAMLVLDGTFQSIRQALAQPDVTSLVVALNMQSIAEHGLPFEICDTCIILGLPDTQDDQTTRLQLAGLPLLVTQPNGRGFLNSNSPELAELITYARCPVTWFQ